MGMSEAAPAECRDASLPYQATMSGVEASERIRRFKPAMNALDDRERARLLQQALQSVRKGVPASDHALRG
jgi:hypothetical protein